MAAPLIFIPDVRGPQDSHLTDVGLGALLGGPGPDWAEARNGPDGHSGMLCAWQSGDVQRDQVLGFTDQQTWHPAKPNPERELREKRFYIGIEPGRPVTPQDVQRKTMLAGHPVTMENGQQWQLPSAVFMPHTHGLDKEGRFERKIAPRYREFWQKTEKHAAQVFDAMGMLDALLEQKPHAADDIHVEIEIEQTWAFCVEALSLNYRVNADLIDVLMLFSDRVMKDIVLVTIDLPTLQQIEAEKKTRLRVSGSELLQPIGE